MKYLKYITIIFLATMIASAAAQVDIGAYGGWTLGGKSGNANIKNDWNYGNAIEDANQVLGRIALSKDEVAEAKKRLLASAGSHGSPQLNSFGPDFRLARELAEKGERVPGTPNNKVNRSHAGRT